MQKKSSYETRVKAAMIQFNTKETLSKTCHVINKVVPSQTEIIEKRNIVINNKYHEQVRVAKEIGAPVRTSKQYGKTSVVDKDYGPNSERLDADGDMYEQLKNNHFEMLLNQQKNSVVLEYAIRGQHVRGQGEKFSACHRNGAPISKNLCFLPGCTYHSVVCEVSTWSLK